MSVRSYINDNIKAEIQVSVDDLNLLCDEYDLKYISLNEYDPSYMSGEELNLTDNNHKTKTYPLPKVKPITVSWIIKKINTMKNTEKAYKNLAKKFSKLSDKFENNMNVYPATYGIGIQTLYTDTDNEFMELLTILNDASIEYRLEWSDAMWVKRIIISKSKDNLEKLELIKI